MNLSVELTGFVRAFEMYLFEQHTFESIPAYIEFAAGLFNAAGVTEDLRNNIADFVTTHWETRTLHGGELEAVCEYLYNEIDVARVAA